MTIWGVTHSLWHVGASGTTLSLSFLSCLMEAATCSLTHVPKYLGGWALWGPHFFGGDAAPLFQSRNSGEGGSSGPHSPAHVSEQAGPVRDFLGVS